MTAEHIHIHVHQPELLLLTEKLNQIMATQTELAASIAAITTNVEKIGTETRALLDKVQALTDALATAGNTTPEVDAAVAALQAQVAVVDGLVPDAP